MVETVYQRLARHRFHMESNGVVEQAFAQAARLAASTNDKLALQLAANSRRMRACRQSFKVTLSTPSGKAPYLNISHTRGCGIRVCPICGSYECERHIELMRVALDVIDEKSPFVPIFLTLTMKNVPIAKTSNMLSAYNDAHSAFFMHADVAAVIKAYFTSIEIPVRTLPATAKSPTQDAAGAHSHTLALCDPAAFTDHRYLRQAKLVQLWRHALGVSYAPVVDIRRVGSRGDFTGSPATKQSIRELIKYPIKPSGFFRRDAHKRLTVDPLTLTHLWLAIKGKRLIRYDSTYFKPARAEARLRLEHARRQATPHSSESSAANAGVS